MPSNFFNPSGSNPPWPSICISKPKPKPKPGSFPPTTLTIILSLNWDDLETGPQNWIGSLQAHIDFEQPGKWIGVAFFGAIQIDVDYFMDQDGEEITIEVTALNLDPQGGLQYAGTKPESNSLIPYQSGPLTLNPTQGAALPSTGSAFG